MEENQLAFNSVIDTKSFTFDLKVIADPDGAKISYFLRGDTPEVSADPSTVTLSNLTKAIWVIHAEKGNCVKEAEFDPLHEAIRSIELRLVCK